MGSGGGARLQFGGNLGAASANASAPQNCLLQIKGSCCKNNCPPDAKLRRHTHCIGAEMHEGRPHCIAEGRCICKQGSLHRSKDPTEEFSDRITSASWSGCIICRKCLFAQSVCANIVLNIHMCISHNY